MIQWIRCGEWTVKKCPDKTQKIEIPLDDFYMCNNLASLKI